jgi:hypothetical protein
MLFAQVMSGVDPDRCCCAWRISSTPRRIPTARESRESPTGLACDSDAAGDDELDGVRASARRSDAPQSSRPATSG